MRCILQRRWRKDEEEEEEEEEEDEEEEEEEEEVRESCQYWEYMVAVLEGVNTIDTCVVVAFSLLLFLLVMVVVLFSWC